MDAQELKTLRKSTGLAVEKYANLVLDTTANTVRDWESGRRPIPALKQDGIRAATAAYLKARATP